MFSKINVLCLALTLVSGSFSKDTREYKYCYSTTNEPQYDQFATKTAYAMINGTLPHVKDGCEATKIWVLGRHGAIHPSSSTIDELKASLGSLRDLIVALTPPPTLCPEDLNILTGWNWLLNETDLPEVLSKEGRNEVKTLAADYKSAYGGLFSPAEKVLFRHTTEPRNKESIIEFATALFDSIDVADRISENDILLKSYENCSEWIENQAKLNESDSNLSKFEKSDLFKDTVKGISDRLELSEELTVKQVENIWNMCRFEKAWDNKNSSAWCSAFERVHINVLEYHEDIKLFYKTGHGEDINSRLACKPVADLIHHLENEDTSSPKAIVSFADAVTIQLLLTALGTHKDTVQPSTDNIVNNRKWKSSEMSPFASNLAVVKFNCSDGEHQVKLFLNQKPLDLEGCNNDDGVCTLNKFVEIYRKFKDADCNEYYCSSKAKTVHGVFAIVVSLILIIYLH